MTETAPRIVNTWDQLMAAREAGLPDVGIYARYSGSAAYRDGWGVRRPGFDISEGQRQHWSEKAYDGDHGRLFRRHRYQDAGNWRAQDKAALVAAMEWCKSRFLVTEWSRNRSGDYVDARVNERFPLPKRSTR